MEIENYLIPRTSILKSWTEDDRSHLPSQIILIILVTRTHRKRQNATIKRMGSAGVRGKKRLWR